MNPTGLGWVAEGAPIPAVDLNDSAVVAVAKLAGLVTMSNEFADDNELPIGDLLRKAVADSMGPTLDSGLMFGSGPPEPEGVLDSAPEAIGGPDFRADMITAWGKLVDAGADGASIVAFASARVVAWELSWTTTDGVPIHADGAEAMVGQSERSRWWPRGLVFRCDRHAAAVIRVIDGSWGGVIEAGSIWAALQCRHGGSVPCFGGPVTWRCRPRRRRGAQDGRPRGRCWYVWR